MDTCDRHHALQRARQGNSQAKGELLESFRPYIRVIVHGLRDRRVQARLDDSDLIQDALLEAHRSFPDFRGTTVAELTVWLRQIVLRSAGHTLRNQLGTDKRNPAREQHGAAGCDVLADAGSSPSAVAIRQEQALRMAEALALLSDDMQQVLLLRHVDGLTHAAIAQQLGRTETAVRMFYLRALRQLREVYRE
jgi:RNA polymerase sigma-70 factor (ECF subfamily)